jgi:RNA polymerase sigma-70 factor (ECF subfamily)
MAQDEDDRRALAAWQAGDRTAGEELLERHFARVFRFFRNKLPAQASDLAQQTFLAALEAKQRIAADRSFRAYLFGIARNLLYGELRRVRPDLDNAGDISIVDTGIASPSLGYVLREEKRLLLGALRRLPLEHQIALELYYWEDLPVRDVAEIIGVPEGTVRSRLARARDALRELLAAPNPEVSDALRDRTIDELDRWARELRDALEPD